MINNKKSFQPLKINRIRILTIIFITLIFSGCESGPTFRGSVYSESVQAPDFTLTDQYNQPFTLSDHKGKITLIFFGYIYCPDVCPMTLSTWAIVQKALKEDADKVQFLFITVDPERDTPQRLKKHLAIFSDAFVGLTGTQDELELVFKDYGVVSNKEVISESASGYLVGHTAWIYVIDQTGKARLSYLFDSPADDIIHDIKQILKYPKGAESDQ